MTTKATSLKLFTRLSSSYFVYFALLGLVSTFSSVFLDGKGFTSIEIGEILAIITTTKIIAPSLWAMIADKTGKQLAIIQLGALLALLSFSALFWLNGYWPITFCLALFSLFSTAILPQLEVLTLASLRHSSKIYARVRLWGSLGFIVLAILAGQVMSYFSSDAFTYLGLFILAALLFSTLRLKQVKRSATAKINGKITTAISLSHKLLDSKFIAFFVGGVLLQISFAPFYGFFALFLRDLSYPGFTVGLLVSLGVVAEVVAFIYMGSLFKHFALKTLLVFSLAVTALRWFLVPQVADSLYLLACTQLIHAASFAVYHSASMRFLSMHFTKRQQGRAQGVYLGGVYGVGGAIGAYVTGVLWLDGSGATTAFTFAGFSALLGAIFMMFLKEK